MGTAKAIIKIPFSLSGEQRRSLQELLPDELPEERKKDALEQMVCREYLIVVEKYGKPLEDRHQ